MPAYLDTIIAAHRAAAAGDGRQLDAVLEPGSSGRTGAPVP